jgi:hypothetical protein
MVTSFTKKWLEGLQHDEPHNIAHHETDSKNNTVVARKIGTQHGESPSSFGLRMMNGIGRHHIALSFIPYIP